MFCYSYECFCSSRFVILTGTVIKLNYKNYMIASIQIANTEIFAFIVVLVKLLSCKVLFINRKDNRKC